MFKITSYWAAQEVTWSKHIIEVWWKKILLDCWMFQWRRKQSLEKNKNFWFEPKEIDAVILSHAHIDHCWLLPKLVKDWFKWKIYSTKATKDLVGLMLIDSAYIQECDAQYYDKHKKELVAMPWYDPLYTKEDVEPTMQRFETHAVHDEFFIWEVKAKFYWASHVLWAALTHIEFEWKSLLYTWDLWRKGIPMLINPEAPYADCILMESTYWWRKHEPVELNKMALVKVITETAARWWKVIIPSFALERTQEVLFYLEEAFKEGLLWPITIYVDSPLTTNVTQIFKKHTQCYNKTAQQKYNDTIPFQDKHIVYTKSVDESKKINDVHFPCVVISASWMIEAWRIRHHVKNNIEDQKNTILIVGYMAKNTLWRKLVEKEKIIKIFWQSYNVRADIIKLNSFSWHADEDELLHWLSKISIRIKNPEKIILVHWEEEWQKILKEKIWELWLKVEIAEFGKSIEI